MMSIGGFASQSIPASVYQTAKPWRRAPPLQKGLLSSSRRWLRYDQLLPLHTMARAVKVAVSLPADLFRAVEKARRQTEQTRSAVFQQALYRWLASHRQEELVQRYTDGYLRAPEAKAEIEEATALAVQSFFEKES
jgi:hypothetical protein